MGTLAVISELAVGATVGTGRRPRLRWMSPEGRGLVDLLVERARAGDLDAFERLVERSLPEVYRLAAGIVGPDDARDVAQEVFVAAWRELPRLRDNARFEPWLRSIVMNRARNTLRARRRRPTVSLIHDGVASTAEPIAAAQRRLDIERALQDLNADQREVIVLHYLLDLPLREVADVLRVPEGTAKSRLHSGLRVLRARDPGP
jgi:RNA polymerase sigma-70 factor (ECF subfamily)